MTLRSVLATGAALLVFWFGDPLGVSAHDLIVSNGVDTTIERQAVAALPATDVKVAFATSHGRQEATFSGVLLWTALQSWKLLEGLDERARLNKVVVVIAKDGYRATLSLAEIDPDYEGKLALLAYRRDGSALPDDDLRLVVPGDKRGGRSVKSVTRIEIR